jgi:hypothetical protein
MKTLDNCFIILDPIYNSNVNTSQQQQQQQDNEYKGMKASDTSYDQSFLFSGTTTSSSQSNYSDYRGVSIQSQQQQQQRTSENYRGIVVRN